MFEFKNVPQLSQIRHLTHSQGIELKAFCFDMDGTLFNTEALHLEVSWRAMSEVIPNKVTDKQAFNQLIHGMSDDQVSESFNLDLESQESKDFFDKRKAYWDQAFEKGPQIFLPEIPLLLEEIKDAGYPMALVTSSSRQQCSELMKMTQFIHFFDHIITRDDVINPKPSPEPYLLAFSKLEIAAENCLIFEDSQVGMNSALASKSHVARADWY